MRSAALALLLIGCASTNPDPDAASLRPVAPYRSQVPTLERCLPPVPPPPVPPAPRTVERLASYAWSEASARWKTAERLADCRRSLDRAIEWIESNR